MIKKKQLRRKIVIIGEGNAEEFYFKSLKQYTRNNTIDIQPKQLGCKAKSLRVIEQLIKEHIKLNDDIYVLIDMDINEGKAEYLKLKNKYEDKVNFIESHQCIEIWILFHFLDGLPGYDKNSKELCEVLNNTKFLPGYNKSNEYYNKQNFIERIVKSGGRIEKAVANSKKSMKEVETVGRNYSYSNMHLLMEKLGITETPKELLNE